MLSVAPQAASSQGMFGSCMQMMHACCPLSAAFVQSTSMPPSEGLCDNCLQTLHGLCDALIILYGPMSVAMVESA